MYCTQFDVSCRPYTLHFTCYIWDYTVFLGKDRGVMYGRAFVYHKRIQGDNIGVEYKGSGDFRIRKRFIYKQHYWEKLFTFHVTLAFDCTDSRVVKVTTPKSASWRVAASISALTGTLDVWCRNARPYSESIRVMRGDRFFVLKRYWEKIYIQKQ